MNAARLFANVYAVQELYSILKDPGVCVKGGEG